MKNMTKVLTAVALSGSLFFSTLGDSASAAWFNHTEKFKKNEVVTYTFMKSDSGATKQVEVGNKGRITVVIDNGYEIRNANFNLVLSNNKRLKIKDGLVYSKGKLYTGTATTKKVLKKHYIHAAKKEEFQLTLTIKNGKVVKGSSYKKLWYDDGVTPG